jgi:sugar phosphate isomerase/epimerase
MLSVSTTWNAALYDEGTDIVRQIRRLGVNSIELGFSLSEKILRDISALQHSGAVRVSSVHNFCPVPDGYDPFLFTPDHFSLSSPQEEERRQAVILTKQSIQTAGDIGAGALVIHAGRVEMPYQTKQLAVLYDQGMRNSQEYAAILDAMKREREEKKHPYVRAIKRSIEELLGYAVERGIMLGLENRYYFREIPSFDEIGILLDEFAHPNLGYWHDVGHAQVAENLGFVRHADFLERYGGKMIGIHLHDVLGGHDHKIPGKGNFDFSILKPYLKKNTIKVLEVHQPAGEADMKQALFFLKTLLSAVDQGV